MADFDLTQSGQEIQDILNGAAMQTDLTAETERAEQAEQQLQDNIDVEETRAKAAEKQNADDIDVIEGKIPAAASSENQLADKAFVNSSIATATATYRGAYNLVSDLHLTIDATEQQIAAALAGAISTADNNDYCFVQIPTADATPTQIAAIERYKFNGTAWAYEYTLNNSGFTADQWAALNSGITTGLVAKLAALPTNDELTLLLGGKQDVLTFDNVPTEGSNNPVKSGGVKSAIDSEKERAQGAEQVNAGIIAQVVAMIPAAASSENQLADKNFVNSSIATNTATYRGAYNEVSDLSLTVDATHEQIASALAGAISTADNNDYCFVQVPTADATPTQIAAIERYKFNGEAWAYEYTLNNSGFTADQWAAINSGITSGLVAKLAALPTNDDLVAALAGKQPMLTFDNVPTESSTNPVKSGGVYAAIAEEAGTRAAAIAAIVALIPSAASALNQLADKAFVNSSISTATAVFKGTFNVVADLELNYNASQAQIALMLGSKIASADNNDYCFVQIPTSNETPLEIARTDRYKYNGTAWAYEYTLNNSGFTAAQWAAINSGITSLLKDKLIDLPTATEITTQLAAKQNALTFDTTPTEGSTNPVTSDGIHAAIDTEKARALAVEQGLQDDYDDLYALYQTLEGGSIIPVAAADWPVSNPQQNVIYRVANSATPTAYSDYMYNGTTTLLLATFAFPGIDSEPTPDSTNLVTSGGTFDAIMQNGPAFDLSAYNAVGGTLATYADLSAALTALNALPAAYKKVGMSFKYVQTSDNKYVQFRCMADEFTTDISAWQGVDAEPIAGSQNLVKSGGVYPIKKKTENISIEELVGEEEKIEFETDNGEKIAEVDNEGIHSKSLKIYDEDKEIDVKERINDIKCIATTEQTERVSIEDDEENEIVGFSEEGVFANDFFDKEGNSLSQVAKKQNQMQMQLLNRYKPLYDIYDGFVVSQRPQSKICAFKSFVPLLNYTTNNSRKGIIHEENNLTSQVVFKEKFVHLNVNSSTNAPSTFLSDNGKDWQRNDNDSFYNYSSLGRSQGYWGLGANDKGLIVSVHKLYSDTSHPYGTNRTFVVWSLNGGKSFEPAVDNARAKAIISPSDIVADTTIVIDGRTLYLKSESDIYAATSAMTGNQQTVKTEMLAYLEDKVAVGDNDEDNMRYLAGKLIELGFFVRLESDKLNVYYKTIGVAGNNQTFIIGSTTKTFSGGVDMTLTDMVDAASIMYQTTGITHADGNAVLSKGLVINNSINFINGKWHFFGHYVEFDSTGESDTTSYCTNVDLVIDDVSNLPNTTHNYYKILSESSIIHCEPVASFDNINNRILVGFRHQSGKNTAFSYSTDYGQTWSELIIVDAAKKIKCSQDNAAVFCVVNPRIDSVLQTYYNRPQSGTENMYVCLVYNRRLSTIFAATAKNISDIDNLEWSDFVPLNRWNEDLNAWGTWNFTDTFTYDESGNYSIGAFCYAPFHKCLGLLYCGGGKNMTYSAFFTMEEC